MQNTLTSAESEKATIHYENSSWCLVCDSRLVVAESSNIFHTSLRRDGESLASYILRVLRTSVAQLRTSYVCSRCYQLFKNLEQAQRAANTMKREILNIYRSSKDAAEKKNVVAQDQSSHDSICTNERPSENIGIEEIKESVIQDELSENNDRVFFSSFDVDKMEISNFHEAITNDDESRLKDLSFPLPDEYGRIEEKIENMKEDRAGNHEKYCSRNRQPSKIVALSEEIGNEKCVEESAITVRKNEEESRQNKLKEQGSWKSGGISKYSQKPLKYSCSNCEKKWRTLAELKTHVKSHSNLRPYMCEKCGQAYKHKHALEIHVGMHNGTSPFRCNVCDKCFTQKGALMRHLPMHTGETPYQCELCGKRFVHHTSYNMHALSHTGKKSYQCHVCDLSLLSTSHLKRHMRVHTGEKPYSCALCGKSFAERYNLFAHRKIHDPAEIMAKAAKKSTFKCDQCDKYFDKKEKLDEHTAEHANTEQTSERKLCGHAYNENSTRHEEFSRMRDDRQIEESWKEIDYEKFDNSQIVLTTRQTDNETTQESLNIFGSRGNYDEGIIAEIPNSGTLTGIDETRI